MSSSIRVLLVAEAANPEGVSVPLVGWSHAEAVMRATDSHLVTQVRNRDAIVRFGYHEGNEFTVIDSERVARKAYALSRFLRRLGLGWTATAAMSSLAYYSFEYHVWQVFKDRLVAGDFDVVHRVTPLSPTSPSYFLANKCASIGVPFVVGPLNGGVPWPKGYGSVQRAEGEWLSYVRSVYKLLPGYRATIMKSSAIVAGSYATYEQLPLACRDRCVYIPENAVDPCKFRQVEKVQSKVLHVVFVGRLVPYKGAEKVVLAAASALREGKIKLHIIGDGVGMPGLRQMCKDEQIEENVILHGWVKHSELLERLKACDVLAFPSIREFGGGVVLEAMAMGIVPIVVDYAGPGELVAQGRGYKVPMGSPDQIVNCLKEIFENILRDPSQLDDMRGSCVRYAQEHFTWDAKAKKMIEVYKWVLGRRMSNPELDAGFLSCPKPAYLGVDEGS